MYITLLSFHIVTLFIFLPEYVDMYVYMCVLLLLHLNNKIEVCYSCCCCYSVFFMRVYMWLRERDWWWCSAKKKEKPLFFLLLLPRSLSIVFDWCDIWRRRPISLLFLLSVGFYLLAKCILNELWFDEERETERTRQDNCVHYWNKWSCYTTSEQNDGRVRRRRRRRRRRDEWGNHFLLLLLPSYKK